MAKKDHKGSKVVKSKKSGRQFTTKEKPNSLDSTFLILILISIFVFLMMRGAYFSFDKYISYIVILSISLISSFIFLIKGKKLKLIEPVWINYILLGFLLYFIFSFLTSVYFRVSLDETFLWLCGILLLYLTYNNTNYENQFNIFYYGFIIIGVLLSLIPFFDKLGLITFKASIVSDRFASVLQYPNTFSSFLLIPISLSFFAIYRYEKRRGIFSIITSFLSITIFLTESRGGLIVLLFILILIPFFVRKDKIKFIFDEVFLILLIPLFYIFLEPKIGMFLSLLLCLILSYLYSLLTQKFKFIYSIYTLIILFFGIFIIFEFSNSPFLNRFLSIFSLETYKGLSGLSGRNGLMLTSLNIFKSYPVFGSGPGTYQFVYFKFRPLFQFSKFPHSTPFQILSETGIIGMILYISLLYFIFKKLLKNLKTNNMLSLGFSFAFLGILLHSFIDFDLSIPAIFYIFFILLGILFSIDLNKKEVRFVEIKKFTPYISIVIIVLIFLNIFFVFGTQFNNKGSSFLNVENFELAETNLKQAVTIDPLNSEYHYNLGQVFENLAIKNNDMNYLKKSNDEFKKAVNLNPMFFLYHSALGGNYIYLNDQEKAIDEFKKTIELNPLDPTNYYNLGLIYEKFNIVEEAKKAYQESLKIDSKFVDAFKKLADLEKKEGNINKVIELYRQILLLEPDNEEIIEELKNLGDKETISEHLSIKIRYPKTDTKIMVGSLQKIEWEIISGFSKIRNITIYYSEDNGKNWNILQSSLDPSINYYEWKIPNNVKNFKLLLRAWGKDGEILKDIVTSNFIVEN